MKKIILILSVFLFSCSNSPDKKNNEKFYYDLDCKIIKMESNNCKVIFIQNMQDETMYTELKRCDDEDDCSCVKIDLSDKNFYSHKVGDMLHFDYIKKSRFFQLDQKLTEEPAENTELTEE